MTVDGRLGVLGGRFDPIHLGHLATADAAQRHFALDQVLLLPSRVSPHRTVPAGAPDDDRLAMVRLAANGHAGLAPCDLELRADGPSYTSVTLDRLRTRGYRRTRLFFIVGADAFADIATWHNYPAVLGQAHFVVVARPQHPLSKLLEVLPDLRARMRMATGGHRPLDSDLESAPAVWLLDAPTPAISSTLVRRTLASGTPIAGLVPAAVAAYISNHRLYRPIPAASLHD